MAELVLTEQEKKDASYLDWSNESLGKLVKMIGALMNDEYGKESAWITMAAHLLVDLSRKTNSTDTTITVKGCTNEGEEIGDWKINIKRMDTQRQYSADGDVSVPLQCPCCIALVD